MTGEDPKVISSQDIQQLSDQLARLAIVNEFGKTLTIDLDPGDIHHRLAQAALKLFPDSDTLFVSRYDADTQQITCTYARIENQELDPTLVPTITLEPPGRGLQSETIHARKSVVVNDLLRRLRRTQSLTPVSDDGETAPMRRSVLCVPIMGQDTILGVVQVQCNTLNRFGQMDIEILEILTRSAALVLQTAEPLRNLRSSQSKHEALQLSYQELLKAYDETLEGWVRLVDQRNHETESHTRNVVEMASDLAKHMGLNEEQISQIRRGALLHDIGKLGVSDQILVKSGSLDKNEWDVMRKHTLYAYEMIHPIAYLRPALDIPYDHHEWWDGSGYPRGLKGAAIPIVARIFAVVDVWDSLISVRPYRKAWQKDEALEYINTLSGSQFDPEVVKAFIEMHQENTAVKFPGIKPEEPQ
jgi:putative nucleotidyltransferase with HDIG domain